MNEKSIHLLMEEPLPILRPRITKTKVKTRRLRGRRAITPIRNRKKHFAKTRSHNKIEERNDLRVSQRADSHGDQQRDENDKKEHSHGEKREGDEDSDGEGERADAEKHEAPHTQGDSQHPEVTVHPGSVQEAKSSDDSETAINRTSAINRTTAVSGESNQTALEEEDVSF